MSSRFFRVSYSCKFRIHFILNYILYVSSTVLLLVVASSCIILCTLFFLVEEVLLLDFATLLYGESLLIPFIPSSKQLNVCFVLCHFVVFIILFTASTLAHSSTFMYKQLFVTWTMETLVNQSFSSQMGLSLVLIKSSGYDIFCCILRRCLFACIEKHTSKQSAYLLR